MDNREKALAFLSSVSNIHYGGCLVSAYSFYLHEKKYDRVDGFQIVCLSNDFDEFEHNKLYVDDVIPVADATSHFGWTFDGGKTIYDCMGEIKQRYDYVLIVPTHLTERFCESSLNNGYWNADFNRKRAVPRIAKKLEVDLSTIKLTRLRKRAWTW